MKRIVDFFENKFAPVMSDLAEQRHLRAIRDGIIATLPLIIIGSMFLVIGFCQISYQIVGPLLNLLLNINLKYYYLIG